MKMPIAVGLLLAVSMQAAQAPPTDTPDAHVAAAKVAAGEDYQNLFNFMCAAPGGRGGGRGTGASATAPRGGQGAAQGAAQGGGQAGQADRKSVV